MTGWQGAEVETLDAAPWPALLISGRNATGPAAPPALTIAAKPMIFADAEMMALAQAVAVRLAPDQPAAILPLGEIPPPKRCAGRSFWR